MSTELPLVERAMQRFVANLASCFPDIVYRNKPRPAELAKGTRLLVVLDGDILRPADGQLVARSSYTKIATVEGYLGIDLAAGEDAGESLHRFYGEVVEAVRANPVLEGTVFQIIEQDTILDMDRDNGSLTIGFATDYALYYRTALDSARQAA